MGGIAANNYGDIISCRNYGIIYSSGNTGGIAGVNHGTIRQCENSAMICYSYIANRDGGHRSIGGIAGVNNNAILSNINCSLILYGNYSSSNDKLIQPRMSHITGSNTGTITGSSWTGAAAVNEGLLVSFSWTENGVTYFHDQAEYVRNHIVGLY